jgi:tetratricopeptide (TPR) repeat protein
MNYKTHLWLLLILISACSQPTPEEHIAKSQLLISENKSSEAIIELKKAIKLSPQTSEIRLMLGELYFEQADYVQAEKEMLKSLELGQSPTQVVPLIAHLYTITKKPEDTLDIIERFNDAIEKSDNSELLFYKGYALMSIDQASSATSTFSLAVDTNTSKFSNLSAAYLDWIAADKESANAKIDDLIAKNEDFAQAHMARVEFNIENNLEKTIIKHKLFSILNSTRAICA